MNYSTRIRHPHTNLPSYIIRLPLNFNLGLLYSVELHEDLVWEKTTVLYWHFTFRRHACGGGAQRGGEDETSSAVPSGFTRMLGKQNTLMLCCAYLVFHSDRYPVLFAVDDFQTLYQKTKYWDPHTIVSYVRVHATFNQGTWIRQKIICACSYSISFQRFNCVILFCRPKVLPWELA